MRCKGGTHVKAAETSVEAGNSWRAREGADNVIRNRVGATNVARICARIRRLLYLAVFELENVAVAQRSDLFDLLEDAGEVAGV